MKKRESIWYTKYLELKEYVEDNKHLPNKKRLKTEAYSIGGNTIKK